MFNLGELFIVGAVAAETKSPVATKMFNFMVGYDIIVFGIFIVIFIGIIIFFIYERATHKSILQQPSPPKMMMHHQ